ncbi:hypothetical protein OIU84_018140 [Salix udensis]|uniref:Uncharacterized protein n=1 Tax=Salix udensis TaxID=889485 RepID=A0AAD6L3F5_9ROSI|nr:hypothetical protein OIU84_018140 [Salix udensis]
MRRTRLMMLRERILMPKPKPKQAAHLRMLMTMMRMNFMMSCSEEALLPATTLSL